MGVVLLVSMNVHYRVGMLPARRAGGKCFLSVFLLSHGWLAKPVQCRVFFAGLPGPHIDRSVS
ncbi:hypothetical protein EHN06_14975 [Marinobacter sp. NP-4(2019)]|nr:hypothetical protein EHN06_14975 [Marinobacter sp. NP-4(2019)]